MTSTGAPVAFGATMNLARSDRGKLVVISGPSGSGKTTVVRRLLETCRLPLVLSVSVTTRPPRPGETNGREYYFLSLEEFQRRRQAGQFLECAEVFGNWYGTLRSEVDARRKAGNWVVLEIDVQGACRVFEQEPDCISIFLKTPSWDAYEQRLRGRRTEDEAGIRRRLEGARRELEMAEHYRYEVINDTLDRAVESICAILKKEAD